MPRRDRLHAVVATVALALLAPFAGATPIPSEPANVRSLNGTWRFKIEQRDQESSDQYKRGARPRPVVLPKTFEPFQTLDYKEDSSWSDIPVPANWEMHGHSVATYNNPDNTIGLYRLSFDVPAEWKDRVIKINFDGVQNGAELYCNGQGVKLDDPSDGRPNFHQGGHTAFQADLTPYLKVGEKNLLAIRVYKNTKEVDLDSGDYFFLGGVHRPVTLFAVPKAHVEDYKVETKLLPHNKAELKVIVTKTGDATPSISLEGVTGNATATSSGETVTLTQTLDNPKLWSAEHPNLYTLNVDLKSDDGQTLEHLSHKIGVREVTIKDGVFLVNNVPVKLAGICRHDVWPDLGTALGEEQWRKDIALMKAANINAIRTSHYPYGSGFYDLCDEMGVYVADEVSGCWCPVDKPELFDAWKQHAREMVRRDKNHPSIVIWAIGNENKDGPANRLAAEEIHKADTTRPRLASCKNVEEAGVELDDAHYVHAADCAIANRSARRAQTPMIYLENPNNWEVRNGSDWGDMDRWAAVIDRTWQESWDDLHVPGHFLWEWQDRAVADPFPDKLYDFDPKTGINLLKVKGLCDAFRNPRPWYYHVKMAYAPVKLDLTPALSGSSVILHARNDYSFTNLSELTTTTRLLKAGQEIHKVDARLTLAPLSTGDLHVDLPGGALSAADTLRVTFTHPGGTEVATYDLALKSKPDTTPALDAAGLKSVNFPRLNLTVVTNVPNPAGWRRQSRLAGQLANITVQKSTGPLTATPLENAAALYALPLTDVRSMDADVILPEKPTDLFDPGMPPGPPAVSGDLGQLPPNAPADPKGQKTYAGHVRVDVNGTTFTYRVNWWRQSDTAQKPADLQELGWVFTLPKSADHFSWDRKAYWSYYPDTHVGRPTGTATPDSAEGQYATRITRPDAFDFNSTKFDCNWARLADPTGAGLAVAFAPDRRAHCRADTARDGSRVLVVDAFNSPPRDISSGQVEDLYYTLHRGQQLHESFHLGATTAK